MTSLSPDESSEGRAMIRHETDGALTRLVLDRPARRNALTGAMAEAIHAGVCRAAPARMTAT